MPEPHRRGLRGCDRPAADGSRCPHALHEPRHDAVVSAWLHWRTYRELPTGPSYDAPRWLAEGVRACDALERQVTAEMTATARAGRVGA